MASSSENRRHRGSRGGVGLWLRRNVWLVAAATFVVLYCAFMVRTTMWARAFGVEREQQAMAKASDQEAMAALKERGENAREEAEEQAEEAVEHGREQLVKGQGEQEAVGEAEAHNAHADATAGPRLRTEAEEDTVAYDDKVPLEDAGDIPVVGATSEDEVDVLTPTEEAKTHNWTAFNDLPFDGGAVRGKEAEAPENNGPKPLTAMVVETGNDTEHMWTGVDKLPVAGEGTAEQDAHVPPAVINTTAVAGSGESGNLIAVVQVPPPVTKKFDTSRLVLETPEQSNATIPFEKRHQTIFGYNATMAYLQLYTKSPDSQEQLFLFFTCSDAKGNRDDWTPNCATAREKVYATFAKSPSTNRLVTIHTGPREDWMGGNAFTDDVDLRLKAIPTVMRWDGGVPGSLRSTWGVLVDHSIMYEPLLRYLFRNADEQDKMLVKPEVETKEIITMRGYAQYRAYMETYAQNGTPYPLFMMMVSGRFQHNNRLWCPWCRQSEMPVEYAFYAYAPAKAKLVLVETYDKYSEWRNPENDFKQDPQLAMKGVPWFYRVFPGPPGQPLTYQRVKKKFYLLEALQQVFEGSE
ncbi:uncharacterized protein IUM83_10534 [Phytophthora cinnamomi]|uniref:uncharacterized protein n=1 Tax=Phytophthora cinnamomi TaxID=4785 RepID=UPI003559F8F5|nr:hypothetical protein IUM83_10534 [Phytophthora cinnamomi]